MISFEDLDRLERQFKEAGVRIKETKARFEEAKAQPLPTDSPAAEAEASLALLRLEIEAIQAETAEHKAATALIRAQRTLLHQEDSSVLLDYLRNTEELVLPAVCERASNPHRFGMIMCDHWRRRRVHGKVYPRVLRPWAGFAAAHAATFAALVTGFGERALFPSAHSTQADGRSYRNEFDTLSDCFRRAIERPVETIATKYLTGVVPVAQITLVHFRENQYDHTTASIPDKWGVVAGEDHSVTRIFAYSYMEPDHFATAALRRFVAAHPGDDYFARALPFARSKHREPFVPGNAAVAHALCVMYHDMVSAGLVYGCIATHIGLILLCVDKEDPDTLYYYFSLFPEKLIEEKVQAKAEKKGEPGEAKPDEAKPEDAKPEDAKPGEADRPEAQAKPEDAKMAVRAPQDTTVSHMVSFCLWAAETTPQPASWIFHATKEAETWPNPYVVHLPDPDDSQGDGDHKTDASPPAKRVRREAEQQTVPA